MEQGALNFQGWGEEGQKLIESEDGLGVVRHDEGENNVALGACSVDVCHAELYDRNNESFDYVPASSI